VFDQTLKRAVPYGWVVVAVAAIYVLFVLAVRFNGTVRLPAAITQSDVPAAYRGNEPRIAHFYAGAGVITRGESAVVCYGVLNVRSVRLEPAVEQLSPSINRCFAIEPKDTTTYRLIAEGNDGRPMTASFTVHVNPAPPRFSMLATSAKEIVRGDRWAVCYSVENALSVRLDPNRMSLPVGQKRCFMLFPVQTTEFRIIATGENQMTAVEKFGVKVVAKN
jgi:hypothetical protein